MNEILNSIPPIVESLITIVVSVCLALLLDTVFYRQTKSGQRMSDIKDHSVTLMVMFKDKESLSARVENEQTWDLEVFSGDGTGGASVIMRLKEGELNSLQETSESRIMVLSLRNVGVHVATIKAIEYSHAGEVFRQDFLLDGKYEMQPQEKLVIRVGAVNHPSAIVLDYPDYELVFRGINSSSVGSKTPEVKKNRH